MMKLIANIKLKSSLLLLLLLSSLFYIDVKSQSDIIESNELIYLNDDLNEEIIADSLDQKKDDITISALPFALYSEIFGWAAGGFVGVQGLSQKNMSLYMGGLISTNG
ncbi:MAG: hypothetical protein IT276_06975, partial [Ignavibacteriaceae bacterium]|nr:hypothetical protein [Ignavibacteriaceae bacterium]